MNRCVRAAAAIALLAVAAAPAAAQIFTDMANHPARRAAERLAAKGVVTRLPDGRLAPDDPLTRLDVAVSLARVLGLPTGGIPYLDFRDTDQIPPGDRAAVAAASIMGTVSATRVEIRKGTVVYTLTTNKTVYAPDEPIQLNFSIANEGPGVPTEILSADRGRPRVRLSERDGAKVGYQGEVYVETRTPQGTRRDRVARIQIKEFRPDGAIVDILDQGSVEWKPGLKALYLQDVWFEYSSTQFYDFVVRDADGNEMARWSLNRPFQPVAQPIPLAAGTAIQDATRWRQLDQNDRPVRPGRYELVAVHTTKENPTELSITFQRGIIAAFPDNTFRPRQPVTRADLAVFMVRAMGLETEARRRANDPLQVADARDIPAEARGSVVVALEKKALLPLPDNTFRPARTATRGDAVLGLNVLMETLGRYDYTTATLREVRGGPPPVVVVEDANKQIRSHRVAVVSAIYRNDQVVLLLQLRPGDQLKMLKPTDAGEVMYIEATGR
ncbi:MAG: S-layer homology domain-containing protein [Armatimonadota bacterium]|nr:S-layer homology domain-containing protein [Armatimonadota bacterium]MDR7550074.1 S-layer homology domain-containing protein [Armatimonadota bacterium]